MIIYWELFSVFFKIGLFSFGGGLAMIAFIHPKATGGILLELSQR